MTNNSNVFGMMREANSNYVVICGITGLRIAEGLSYTEARSTLDKILRNII
jgi:hypothetical protein